VIISPKRFWAAIERGALRPTDPPSWLSEHFRSRVSIGLRHVPGSPDHRPRRPDHEDPEAAK
jgi:hypothetical protein